MNVNLTFAQVPSKQALVQTKEAKIKTDKMDNTGNIDKNMDKKEKTTILAKEENIIPNKTLDNATENKVENVEFKSAILNWPEIPNAVMYELIVKNIDTQEVLFTKYNIYASGYQLDNSEVNLSQNLKWQVRGLDENKVPVSDYTKPRLLHKGEMYKLNWQNKGDEYKLLFELNEDDIFFIFFVFSENQEVHSLFRVYEFVFDTDACLFRNGIILQCFGYFRKRVNPGVVLAWRTATDVVRFEFI